MTLQRYEKKYSDTFRECDLSQDRGMRAVQSRAEEKKLFFTRPNTQNFAGISIQSALLIHKLYIILARVLAYWCLPHQKINTVDRRENLLQKKRAKNLLQTFKKRREKDFFDWTNNSVKAILNNFWANEGNSGGSFNLSPFAMVFHIGVGSEKESESSHYSCRKCHFVDSFPIASVCLLLPCIHRALLSTVSTRFDCSFSRVEEGRNFELYQWQNIWFTCTFPASNKISIVGCKFCPCD
jgi:hypothetical protein